ncbi:MAG: hypothetical protein ACJ77K_00635 [Bacteroidia bacterium]
MILNVSLACFFWFLSIVIAGLGEYPYSAWTLVGMFFPGILFYCIRKGAKTVTSILLIANFASLFYPLLAFASVVANFAIGKWEIAEVIYLLVTLTAIYFFVRSSLKLFSGNLKA